MTNDELGTQENSNQEPRNPGNESKKRTIILVCFFFGRVTCLRTTRSPPYKERPAFGPSSSVLRRRHWSFRAFLSWVPRFLIHNLRDLRALRGGYEPRRSWTVSRSSSNSLTLLSIPALAASLISRPCTISQPLPVDRIGNEAIRPSGIP